MSVPLKFAIRIVMVVLLLVLNMTNMKVWAQTNITITSGLADYQVFQRNAHDVADISFSGTCDFDGSGVVQARVQNNRTILEKFDWQDVGQFADNAWTAKLEKLPVGGPYQIEIRWQDNKGKIHASTLANNILVGDLWILAGQSNMQGIGDLQNVEEPSIYVNMFGYNETWSLAIEPLHWLLDSIDPVHHPGLSDENLEKARKSAKRNAVVGAGCGLPFAKEMVKETGVPIGLVPCAHGGTSMEQWSPEKRDEGGNSLYGSMYRRFLSVGGRVKGVLWYQGESDANSEAAPLFHDRFINLVKAIRQDFNDPNLPFYYVQIGRFVINRDIPEWNIIQEQQRLCAQEIPNCQMVTSVDLELDDLIHISTNGYKRIGKRLANLALKDLFGHSEVEYGPSLDWITPVPFRQPRFRLHFKGINGRLCASGRVDGFSLRDASENPLHLILKSLVSEDGQTIDLFLRERPPADAYLWYGYGLNPHCNVVDKLDMALPAFGPIPMDEVNYWPLFEKIREEPNSPMVTSIIQYTSAYVAKHPERASELAPIVREAIQAMEPENRLAYYPMLFTVGDFSKWDEWLKKARSSSIGERRALAKPLSYLKTTPSLSCEFVKNWMIVGPFDNSNDEGYERVYAPEENPDLKAIYKDSAGNALSWRPAKSDGKGYLNFVRLFEEHENGVAYAQVFVESEKEAWIPLLLGSNDAAVVWVNGEEIYRDHHHRGAEPAQDLITAKFKKGLNRILIKVDQIGGGWGLYLQLMDKDRLLK